MIRSITAALLAVACACATTANKPTVEAAPTAAPAPSPAPTVAPAPTGTAAAEAPHQPVTGAVVDREVLDKLGPYRLGDAYDSLKTLPDFEVDEKRTDPAKDVQAGRIINKGILEVPTLQRLIFKQQRLHRISIIFGSPEITEEMAKGWAAKQWGDPGGKVKLGDDERYVWQAPGRLGMLVPADGGRWMVTLSSME